MSRIGKSPVTIPSGVEVKVDNNVVTVKGSKGELTQEMDSCVGKEVAEKAIKAGITSVVFDRNGYLYHGRVKTLADSAREGGLKF